MALINADLLRGFCRYAAAPDAIAFSRTAGSSCAVIKMTGRLFGARRRGSSSPLIPGISKSKITRAGRHEAVDDSVPRNSSPLENVSASLWSDSSAAQERSDRRLATRCGLSVRHSRYGGFLPRSCHPTLRPVDLGGTRGSRQIPTSMRDAAYIFPRV